MRYLATLSLLATFLFTGCETVQLRTKYDQPAYRPKNSSNVVVKVSLQKQMVYVMEGKHPLLITAVCVGTPQKPTPRGTFHAYNKIRNKRSGSYGFAVKGNQVIPSEAGKVPSGWSFVGYPMPYWVEFAPAYGFHMGWVHPIPHTHGCIRLHANDAGDFYELVKEGTPIIISSTQPEDETLGKNFKRPQDYNDPDPAPSFMVSPDFFKKVQAGALQTY